ncbi:PEP-CTERM sorting domain-containing protein [Methyloversatilis sp. XJ19-13]|uniref:exosortase-dependent surface protein XDP1 n=1 Tax=Methyloversatilis sp. XJ19-13 TaxID=2963430 RepID=UPI00211C44A2|nr:exosortase-dependent surface protein XDP1 [Methyloversatilis sp. XJ19-13]MCQ9374462.1 PEP-CTERM sorting domain-containing protein [Methyloversatilis sp. XJ19-13]
MNRTALNVLSAAVIAGLSGVASAATYSWGLDSVLATKTSAAGFVTETEYSKLQYSTGGATMTLQAYADTGASSAIEAAYLTFQGSCCVGVTSRETGNNGNNETTGSATGSNTATGSARSPEHSFDNAGRTELLLVSFDQALSISSLSFGWAQTDNDYKLYAFNETTNSFASTGAVTGKTLGALGAGWAQVGSAFEGTQSGNTGGTRDTDNSVYSRYWLITPGGTDGVRNDYTKLSTIAAKTAPPPSTGVPEPESIALMGAALAGMVFVRRRRQA